METLKQTLSNTLQKFPAITFNGDILSESISGLIKETSKKILIEGKIDPQKNRNDLNQALDDLSDLDHDINDVADEELDTLNLVAQINVLFKTTEIIGQVLKNQYATIERDEKSILLIEIMDGMLRGLACFYDTLKTNPHELINEIEQVIKQQNKQEAPQKIRERAERITSHFIKMISTGMILKTITSINSQKLHEFILPIPSADNFAKDIIKVGVLLDSFGAIPFRELEELFPKIEKNNIAFNILRDLVLRRVYLFPIKNNQDIQRLSDKFSFEQSNLNRIQFLNKDKKLLK